MQQLKVSCAVRRLFKSLGFKGLIIYETVLGESSTACKGKFRPIDLHKGPAG